MRGLLRHSLQKLLLGACLSVSLLSSPAAALNKDQLLNYPYYDSTPAAEACAVGGGIVTSTLPTTVPEPHKTLFTQAAAAFNINPQYLTALFLSEQGNQWKAFDSQWASSPVGASGPFQFMPGTWSGYKTDGNNDGLMDIMNIYDASYSAAKLSATNTTVTTPLGDLTKPFVPGTLLYAAAVYNWGGGNVQTKTNPDSAITAAPKETQNYLSNIHALISSGFTKSGNPAYPDPVPAVSGSATAGTQNTTSPGCGSLGNVVQTAVKYAWPDYHAPVYLKMKPEYEAAIRAAQSAGKYVGGGAHPGIDCGGFVTRVMQDSGLDPNYGGGGNTDYQERYMRQHPELYEPIFPTSTADMRPGDIAINDTHTYLYVGAVAGFNSDTASAAFSTTGTGWRAPMAGSEVPASPNYRWYRHK